MKTIGYIRVSTDEQHLGPEAQRAELERWCKDNGAELAAVFIGRGISGGAPLDKRTELLAAVAALKEHGAEVLLVAKRDRLARDVMVSAMVERLAAKAGAAVVAASGTGNGDSPEALLMRRMVDAFAEYERALIKARTKSALAVKRGRGERTGQIPYGFQLAADGIHLEEHPAEQQVLETIRAMRAEGATLAGVAEQLNLDNVPARGKRWHTTTVARLMKRAA